MSNIYIYSERVPDGKFFINLTDKGELNVTLSKPDSNGKYNNSNRITIPKDEVEKMLKAFSGTQQVSFNTSKGLSSSVSPKHGQPWTQDEEDELKDLFDEGESEAEIAKELGRSEYAIHCRITKLGLL